MPNRGNAQSNKNDDRSQGRDEDEQDVQTDDDVETGVATVAGQSGVDQLTQAVQGLRQRRIAAVAEVGTIDRRLVELREEITQLIGETVDTEADAAPRSNGRSKTDGRRQGGRGRTARKTGAQARPRARGGRRNANGQSGTDIIEEILRQNKGRMESGECARLAEERGVKWPHSSFQSLKKRGRVSLKDGFIEFTDVE